MTLSGDSARFRSGEEAELAALVLAAWTLTDSTIWRSSALPAETADRL